MMAKSYKVLLSTTTVSALSGVVIAIVYMVLNHQREAYFFVLAEFVTVACVVGWLFGMGLLALPAIARSLWRISIKLSLPKTRLQEEGPEWDKVNTRREMIAIRLDVVEPLFSTDRRASGGSRAFNGNNLEAHNSLASGYLVSLANKKSIQENVGSSVTEGGSLSDHSFS